MVDQPGGPRVADDTVLLVQAHRASDCGADARTGAVRREGLELQAAVGRALVGAGGGELGDAVHAPHFLGAEPLLAGVEVALGGDLGAEGGAVEEGNGAGGGVAGAEEVPEPLPAGAARSHDPHSGDDDSSFAS